MASRAHVLSWQAGADGGETRALCPPPKVRARRVSLPPHPIPSNTTSVVRGHTGTISASRMWLMVICDSVY